MCTLEQQVHEYVHVRTSVYKLFLMCNTTDKKNDNEKKVYDVFSCVFFLGEAEPCNVTQSSYTTHRGINHTEHSFH